MPFEVKQYKCQHCGKLFDNIVLAEKHEQQHPKIKDTLDYYNIDKKYPDKVRIVFDNRTEINYYAAENDAVAEERIK